MSTRVKQRADELNPVEIQLRLKLINGDDGVDDSTVNKIRRKSHNCSRNAQRTTVVSQNCLKYYRVKKFSFVQITYYVIKMYGASFQLLA